MSKHQNNLSPSLYTSEVPAFPTDVAFGSAFSLYWDAYGNRSEVCPAFHFASALARISQAIGKSCFIQGRVGEHYLNWYQGLVGTSFLASKSYIAGKTMSSIENMFMETPEMSQYHKTVKALDTPQGIIDLFATTDETGDDLEDNLASAYGVRAFAWIDEMRGMFIKSRQVSSEGLIPMITELWKCPSFIGRQTGGNKTRGKNPFLNILACTTYDWFEESVTISDVMGGFVNRFVFYVHEQQDLFPFILDPNQNSVSAWEGVLTGLERRSLHDSRQFDLDDECCSVYEKWYIETKETVKNDPTNLDAIAGARVVEHTIQLSLLYAVLDNGEQDNLIHAEAFNRAKDVATYWGQCCRWLFRSLAVDKIGKQEQLILEVLKGSEYGVMTRTEIRKKLGSRMNTRDFNTGLESLYAAEAVNVLLNERPQLIYLPGVDLAAVSGKLKQKV